MTVPAFMLEAPCARIDPEIMFPAPAAEWETEFAKSVCERCLFESRCLEYALAPATRVADGVMGGHTEGERKALLKKRRLGRAIAYDSGPIPKTRRSRSRTPQRGPLAPAT
ncbi:WhiB family transcriptional regulator [Streptomyces sp. ARC14]|uniref:WhiB family transcriptional regulator n=1 Tax=Streptomyces sp. ARC14 TaxID=2724152 RepID=UPI0038579ED7